MGCGTSSASKYGTVSSMLEPSLLTADTYTNEKLHGLKDMHVAGLLSNEEFASARTRMVELLPEELRAVPAAKLAAKATPHQVSGPGVEMQKMVEDVSSDLDAISQATGDNFRVVVSQLLEKRHSTMLLLDAEELRRLGRLPRYDQVEEKLVNFQDVGDCDCVLFVSHRWWRAKCPDGDHSEKVHILLEKLPHIRAAQALSPAAKIYVWWDFYSIRQTSANIHKVEKEAQILSIPIYLAASDTCIAFKAGDEEAYTVGKCAPTHKGFYENRVWTMVELYGFSSNYAMQMSENTGRTRYLLEVTLGYEDGKLVETNMKKDQLASVRAQLHDSLNWSLPSTENLTDLRDLQFIEPMLIGLTSTRQYRLHAACRFGFQHAACTFLSLGDDPNVTDSSGLTALMLSTTSETSGRSELSSTLLEHKADPNVRHAKLGVTALHQSASFGLLKTMVQLLDAGADANVVDAKGRTALHASAIFNKTTLFGGEEGDAAEPAAPGPADEPACESGCYAAGASPRPTPNLNERQRRASISVAPVDEEDEVEEETCAVQEDEATQMIRVLVSRGADPCIRDGSGRTALDLARSKGNVVAEKALRGLMTVEQLSCPNVDYKLDFEHESVPFTAKREDVQWTPRDGRGAFLDAHKGVVNFVKFSPTDPAVTTGPTIIVDALVFVGMAWTNWEDEAEAYVRDLGATVYHMVPYEANMRTEYKGENFATISDMWADMIEDVCGPRGVDVGISFCLPAECLYRLSVARPDLCRSVVAASCAIGLELGEDMLTGMMEGWMADPMGMAHGSVAMNSAPSWHGTPQYQKCVDSLYAGAQPFLAQWKVERGKGRDLVKDRISAWSTLLDSPPWAHFKKVAVPNLILVGTDDAAFLAGCEALACTTINAELVYMHGCQHMPMLEDPKNYRKHVVEFCEKHFKDRS